MLHQKKKKEIQVVDGKYIIYLHTSDILFIEFTLRMNIINTQLAETSPAWRRSKKAEETSEEPRRGWGVHAYSIMSPGYKAQY